MKLKDLEPGEIFSYQGNVWVMRYWKPNKDKYSLCCKLQQGILRDEELRHDTVVERVLL